MGRALIVGALVVGLVSSLGWKLSSRAPHAPMRGDVAPVFTLEDSDGARRTLSEWRGRPVVIVFWAPWSPPAARMAAALAGFSRSLSTDAIVVDIALDYIDAQEISSIVGPAEPRCVHLRGRPTELEPWGDFPTLPVTFRLDESGIVRARQEGFLDAAALNALLTSGR